MVSNISFTSTYKVSNQNNGYDRFSSFQDLALEKENEKGVAASFKDDFNSTFPYGYNSYVANYTLTVPDEMDSEIERYCLYNNINYIKLTNRELLDPEAIEYRIAEPKQNMTLTKVNLDRMRELALAQYSNVGHCESDYRNFYKDDVDFMLKSGDDIPVSTLTIIPDSKDVNETVKYIRNYGAYAIEPGQLFVCLEQKTDNPDHCVFFALRDLGMKNIPVYMNIDTYKLANALGIIEE